MISELFTAIHILPPVVLFLAPPPTSYCPSVCPTVNCPEIGLKVRYFNMIYTMPYKVCIKCGEDNLDRFEINKVENEKVYYRSQCRTCYNETVRERRHQFYVTCSTCSCTILKSGMYNHKKTLKHIENTVENQRDDDVESYLQQYY